jgi:hypothetical protein
MFSEIAASESLGANERSDQISAERDGDSEAKQSFDHGGPQIRLKARA